jgi:ankyrin repeat protein
LTDDPTPTRRHCLATLLAALVFVRGGAGRAGGVTDMDTALIEAARQGDATEVARLLAAGADVAARDAANRTALHHATEGNHIGAALALIEAGADVNASDGASIDHTPFLMAGARGYLEILVPMLAHGADLTSTNGYGGTALIPACERGFAEVARVLIEAGTDLDHVNRMGWTALLEAIILSEGGPAHQEIVRMLLEAGADPGLADPDGVTPLAHAEARGHDAIVALLRTNGA